MQIGLPVRFAGCDSSQPELTMLRLATDRMAFLLVDCNGDCGDDCHDVVLVCGFFDN